MTSHDVVQVAAHGGHTAIITIARAEALNALNPEVIAALAETLETLENEGTRHIVLTGAGEKAFVAGADVAAMQNLSRAEARSFARRGQRVLHRLTRYPGVTIAAVNGYALGGGMELAMACDLIVASPNAVFGQPEVKLGVIPGFGGTQRLVRLVGAQRARELIFTGRNVKAAEAVELGIALRVIDDMPVLEGALQLADSIGARGPRAVRWAKKACAVAEQLDIEVGLQEEAEYFGMCFSTEDQREGMSAFLEKRPAEFVGQ